MIEEHWRLAFWRRQRNRLWVPRGLAGPRRLMEDQPQIIARLTLTYHDVYGRTNSSVYDLTALWAREPVTFLKNVSNDLGDLDRKHRIARRPRKAPGQLPGAHQESSMGQGSPIGPLPSNGLWGKHMRS